MSSLRLEVADIFRQHEQEFFARWGSTLTAQQRRVYRDICDCRTAACGARVEQCDQCSERTLCFNSCGNRHCPRCQSSARDRWLTKMARDLLPVPYCHVVFTLPSQLIPLAYQNARLIYNLLFQAASEALLTIAADPKRMGARVGFLAVLHTWNQKLQSEPSLMMPGIIISFVFSEQTSLVLRTVPCRISLPVRWRRSMMLRTGSASRSARRISQGARGAACSRFSRPASTRRSIVW